MRLEITLPPEMNIQKKLFGPNDNHFRLIRNELGISLVARNNKLILDGKEIAVTQASKLIDTMLNYIKKGQEFLTDEISILLEEQVINSTKEYIKGVILTGKNKITSKTEKQLEYIETIRNKTLVFASGPAGSGKTFLAVACAVEALRQGLVKKIVLTRPAVEAGEQLGFLPGDMKEKVDPYLKPIYDALEEMLTPKQLFNYSESGIIEVAPLAFMRGRTLAQAFIILDEAQNTTPIQMKMLLTRIGENSKCVITGDLTQIDLKNNQVNSGLKNAIEILQNIPEIGIITLSGNDIVRHKLVKDIVEAYEKNEAKNNSKI